MNIVPSRKAKVYIVTAYKDTFTPATEVLFQRLASASELHLVDSYESDDAIQIVTDSANIYIPLSDVIDRDKEIARLTAELKKLDGEIERIEKKLSNEGFVSKAPAAVIEGEKEKLAKYTATKAGVVAALEKMQ